MKLPQTTFAYILILSFSILWLPQLGCTPPPSLTAGTDELSSAVDKQPPPESKAESPAAASMAESASQSSIVVTIVDLAGLEETLKSLQGKVIVLDIWSTACAPCMREYPNLVALSQRFPDSLACVSLNVDYIGLKSKPAESYLPPVQEFLQKQKSMLTNLLSSSSDEDVLSKYDLGSMPAILVFSKDGALLHKLTDSNTGDDGLTYEGDVIPLVNELMN